MAKSTHSKHYYTVKGHYDDGTWSITRVRNAVGKWITEEEFFEITGMNYNS